MTGNLADDRVTVARLLRRLAPTYAFLTRSNRAKRRRRSPVPQFLSSPLLKPCDRAGDVGHVQYRSHTFGFHNRSRITPDGAGDLVYCCKIAVSLIDGIHDLKQRPLALCLFSSRVMSYIITSKQ